MTFVAGRTLPARLYLYANDPLSLYTRPLVATLPGDAAYPSLLGVAAVPGGLAFRFHAPAATHFGVALWTDPRPLAPLGANAVPAGHGGLVAAFDLPLGDSTQMLLCSCASTTFPYAR